MLNYLGRELTLTGLVKTVIAPTRRCRARVFLGLTAEVKELSFSVPADEVKLVKVVGRSDCSDGNEVSDSVVLVPVTRLQLAIDEERAK